MYHTRPRALPILCALAVLATLAGRATAAPCIGDCSGDGAITVDEIVTGVNVALGVSPMSACPPFDIDASGTLTVDELVSAVDGALRGCESAQPTPTPEALGPRITSLSIARADQSPVVPFGVDDQGREIYRNLNGNGIWIIVEATAGPNGRLPGTQVFTTAPFFPSDRPDIQVLISRDLGDGNPIVCDNQDGVFNGVPGVDPPQFDDSQAVTDVINEMSCRVDGGGRTRSGDACTQDASGQNFGFAFVNPASQIQFCVRPAAAWAFPTGDTIVAARVRDVFGTSGAVREMVVRVGR
jgi:hypothetical protein